MGRTTMLMADNRPAAGSKGVAYRPAWGFKGETKAFLRGKLEGCPRPFIHVCCGPSNLGLEDVRVDLVHPSADVKADARELPFKNVGTILLDPPWQVAVDERQRFVMGCLRALRPGGWLMIYAPWMPVFKSADLEGIWVRKNGLMGFPHNAVLLTKWVKKGGDSDQLELTPGGADPLGPFCCQQHRENGAGPCDNLEADR